MKENLRINRLPVPIWNRLQVNDASVEWDSEEAAQKEERIAAASGEDKKFHLTITDQGDYSSKKVTVRAEKNSSITIYEVCRAARPLRAELLLEALEGADITLYQLLTPLTRTKLLHRVSGSCGENSQIRLVTVMLGEGDIYCDHGVELLGDHSSLKVQAAYLGKGNQLLDYNMTADHYGKNTESEIKAAGALKDAAKKTFRGTIDFKKGASDSVGSENETVLMLSDEAVNKTVPLILCAEESVEGSHGATIGELDDETLFYFESRGIKREEAEKILSNAAIKRIMGLCGDPEFAGQIRELLAEEDEEEENGTEGL